MPNSEVLERLAELLSQQARGASEQITKNETNSCIDIYSDKSKPKLKCQRCEQILKLLFCVLFIVWVCVAFDAISRGKPSRILLPTNSKGETCGLTEQFGKPNLLYLDITLCAGLNAAESGCSSPTVCVDTCPNTFWTSTQGSCSGLEQFCDNASGRPEADLSQLVEEGICPAYLLPSRSFMGRCLTRVEDLKSTEAKLNEMKTYDGKNLNATNLMEGIEYVKDTFDNLGYDQKLHIYMSVYWWIVPIYLVISALIWTVGAFTFHNWSTTSPDISNQAQVQAEKLKTIDIAFKNISEAKQKVKQNKTTLLFPIIPFFAQVIVLFWLLAVSTNLSSIGSPQFRVVNACSTETCININTEKTFRQDDFCDPDIFSKCTGCPRAQCVFHKFQHKTSRYILHGYNFVVAIVLLFCAHKIVYTLVTDLLIKKMKAEVLSLLACIICGFGKTKLQEVEKTTLEEQEEILIGTSGEGEHQGNQVQRKRESPSRQQRRVRHAAAHNGNPEKVAITETEQDSVQRVNKNNEVQRKGEGPSWQQQPLRQSAAYNANAEKNAITETEQDSVQRVKETNEDSKDISVRIIPIKRCNNGSGMELCNNTI